MEVPARSAGYESTVKCSTCDVNVELSALADHVCATVTTITGSSVTAEPTAIPETQVYYPPKRGASLFRRERPTLLKLDSSVSVRSGLDPREAANIAHDLGLPLPLSAGPGRRSPRTPFTRQDSKPRIGNGPRSPELPVSQDCAFPPFPISKPKRAQTDRDITYTKPRSTSHSASRAPSRARTHQASIATSVSSSVYSSGSSTIVKRKTSQSSSIQRSRQGTLDETTSVASTAPGSPVLSVTGNESSKRESDEVLSSLPSLEPSSIDNASDMSNPMSPATPVEVLPGRTSPFKMSQSPFSKGYQREAQEALHARSVEKISPSLDGPRSIPATTFDQIMPSLQGQRTVEQPQESSYKSKRPPALLQPQAFPTVVQEGPRSARLPTPPLAGGIGRTITNLFGRKRSQSVSSKKIPQVNMDSLRVRALAPDVPEIPKRLDGEFGVSDDSYFPPVLSREEIKQLEGDDKLKSDMQSPARSLPGSSDIASAAESPAQEAGDEAVKHLDQDGEAHFNFSFSDEKHHDATGVCNPTLVDQDLEEKIAAISPVEPLAQEDKLGRASIDSASSYGSVGFSNRTTSSRSSAPPSEENRNKFSMASDSDFAVLPDHQTTSPIPQMDNIIPDSSTDPTYQPSSLSPILETPDSHWSSAAEGRVSPEKSFRAPSRLESLPPRVTTSAASSRPTTPAGTKGICRGCSQMIMAGQKSVSSKDGRLTGRYHKDCFACRTCREPFATADFYVHDDEPYCSHDYHVLNNTLCGACGKGIEGQYLGTSDATGSESKKFHPKCLTCSTCRVQLDDDYFEYYGRIYCERDAFRAASGPRSPYDNAPSRPSPLVREYINSSEPGIKGRFPERRTTRLMMM